MMDMAKQIIQTRRSSTVEEARAGAHHSGLAPSWLETLRARIKPEWLLLAVVAVIALALNFHLLGTISVWYDEAFSYAVVNQHLSRLWNTIWHTEPNMELYYLILYAWLKATSLLHVPPVELILRLPSAIYATLSAVVVYVIGYRFWDARAGFLAALLYAANPLQLFYAQQARAYSLELLLICCAWLALLSALTATSQREGYRWWAVYVAATTLAIYTHVFSALIVIAQIIAFAGLLGLAGPWRMLARRSVRQFALSLCVSGILIIPMIYVSRNGGHNKWIPVSTPGAVVDFFITSVSAGNVWYVALIGLAGALALLSVIVDRLPHHVQARLRLTSLRSHDTEPWRASATRPELGVYVLMCWLVVPLVLSYALTQDWLNLHLFLARYLVVVVPPICMLAVLGLRKLRPRYLQLALAGALVLVAFLQVPAYYASADTQDFRAVNFWLQQRYQPGDGIACYPIYWCRLPMDYYIQAHPGSAHFDSTTPYDDLSTQALAAYAAQHTRVFLIIALFDPSPDTVRELHALQSWMDGHYQLAGQFETTYLSYQFKAYPLHTKVTIRLYGQPQRARLAPAAHSYRLGASCPPACDGALRSLAWDVRRVVY